MKRNNELVTAEITIGTDGFSGGLNVVPDDRGRITKRKGYNTFGEMVDVLWKINKHLKKFHSGPIQYTVTLPLKGTKPIYKKTLANI